LPASLDLESAALTEPLACVVHGVIDTAQVRAGDRAAITGPGPIGLLTLQLVKAAGAKAVMLGTGADAERLRLAEGLGADAVLNVEEVEDIAGAVTELLGAGADLVVECSGAGAAATLLLQAVRRGGRFCQMGLYGRAIPLDMDVVCYKELKVTGSNATVPEVWPRAVRLLAEGKIDAQALITHRYPLEQWEEALATVRNKRGIKVLLTPCSSA
jgi:L-iditol 2-dehydrogenase